MDIRNTAMAGTLESSDVSIVVEPNEEGGIWIEIHSVVKEQFGDQIRLVIEETLSRLKVKNAIIKVHDKGALDCVIKARLQTALHRAANVTAFNWGEESECSNLEEQ